MSDVAVSSPDSFSFADPSPSAAEHTAEPWPYSTSDRQGQSEASERAPEGKRQDESSSREQIQAADHLFSASTGDLDDPTGLFGNPFGEEKPAEQAGGGMGPSFPAFAPAGESSATAGRESGNASSPQTSQEAESQQAGGAEQEQLFRAALSGAGGMTGAVVAALHDSAALSASAKSNTVPVAFESSGKPAVNAYLRPALDFGGGFVTPTSLSASPVSSAAANGLVVSQNYGAGGSIDSVYSQDYVELFNRSSGTVNLNGLSLQYAAPGSGIWQAASLSGNIAPGQYLLVWGVTGPAGQQTAPTADIVTSLDFGSESGKLAVVNTTSPLTGAIPSGSGIVDFVGYGTADAYEGSGCAPAINASTALFRGNGGLHDTNDNFFDFDGDVPAPRNSTSPAANLPPIVSVPSSQWTPQNSSLVFSSGAGRLISVSDYDIGTGTIEITLATNDATLTLSGTSGLTFSEGDGSGDASMIFSGTVSAVNAALNGLTVTPASSFTGECDLVVAADDLGGAGVGGSQSDLRTVLIAVGAPVYCRRRRVAYNEWRETLPGQLA